MSHKMYSPPFGEKTHDLDQVAQWAGRRKILLLEDDVVFADTTRLQLEEKGYEVEWVADGVQGIKRVMV
ncbi:MAG: hypothetical protein ACLQU1_05020, partial [Bryobacteraceae bacterium]